MEKYLEDATDFTDMEVKEKPEGYPIKQGHEAILCPVCKGYGGWNLRFKPYGPSKKYFRASCSQCNGWGWVNGESPDAICIHEDRELSQRECRKQDIEHRGMFCHVYQCVKCNRVRTFDSSG